MGWDPSPLRWLEPQGCSHPACPYLSSSGGLEGAFPALAAVPSLTLRWAPPPAGSPSQCTPKSPTAKMSSTDSAFPSSQHPPDRVLQHFPRQCTAPPSTQVSPPTRPHVLSSLFLSIFPKPVTLSTLFLDEASVTRGQSPCLQHGGNSSLQLVRCVFRSIPPRPLTLFPWSG